jgi:hypothetical protein
MDGRLGEAAMLFGARLGLSPLTSPNRFRFRHILESLEKQGLGEEIAAGTDLSVDEALERVVEAISPPRAARA